MAAASGNNLLYLVLSALLVLWAIELVAGGWNLRGVDAVRRLPAELIADSDASGRIVVRNRRRWVPALAVRVVDEGTSAEALLREVDARSTAGAPVVWRFPRRGRVALRALRLTSRFPFGWIERRLRIAAPADLVVYPRGSASAAWPRPGIDAGVGQDAEAARGGVGDFLGLRAYEAGDRVSAIHWPTTARVGQVTVMQRGGEAEPAVRVVVHPTPAESWESEISRAAGELGRAFARGWRVGLELPAAHGVQAARLPAQGGAQWRRALLEALSLLPEAK